MVNEEGADWEVAVELGHFLSVPKMVASLLLLQSFKGKKYIAEDHHDFNRKTWNCASLPVSLYISCTSEVTFMIVEALWIVSRH